MTGRPKEKRQQIDNTYLGMVSIAAAGAKLLRELQYGWTQK